MQVILESEEWTSAGDLLIEKNLCLQGYVEQFAATLRVISFLVVHGCQSTLKCYTNGL